MPLIRKYTKLPIWLQFALNITFLYAIWVLFYKFLRDYWLIDYFYEEFIYWLTTFQLKAAAFVLKIFGYQVNTLGKVVSIKGSEGILLDRGCLGRNTLGLFIGFILAYPSTFKDKAWIIPLGTVIFIALNVTRISTLALLDYCCPKYLQFNHHFTFKVIIYGVILLMWYIWLKKLRQ